MSTLKLKPFQRYSALWLRRRKFAILGHEPGLGKTAISIESVVSKAVIVCPRFLVGTWMEELEKWSPKSTYKVVENRGQFNRAIEAGTRFILMSYHRFVNLPMHRCLDRVFLLDEAHAFKSFQSKRTQQAINVISAARKVVAITGTPVMNRPIELFPLLSAFGVTRMNYFAFGFKYCAGRNTKYGLDFNGASNLPELQQKLAGVMLRFTKRQVAPELKPKRFKVIPLKFGRLPKQELEYNLKDIMAMPPDIAFETMSLVMKIHAELKFPMVKEYIEWRLQHDKKLVVFTHHREEMSLPLYDGLKKYNPVIVIGGMGYAKIKNVVHQFQTDPTCRIIIVSILAGGVGLTLNAASRAIFAEAAWSPQVIEQAADRLHRITTTGQVEIDILTVQGSIDEYQIRRALEKLEIINQLVLESEMPKANAAKEETLSQRLADLIDDLDELQKELAAQEEEEEEAPPAKNSRGGKNSAPAKGGRSRSSKDEEEEEQEEEEEPEKGGRSRSRTSGKSGGKGGKDKGPTFDDVREASAKLLEEFVEGKEIVAEILQDMGYDPAKHKISALDESEYGDFIDRVEKELAA